MVVENTLVITGILCISGRLCTRNYFTFPRRLLVFLVKTWRPVCWDSRRALRCCWRERWSRRRVKGLLLCFPGNRWMKAHAHRAKRVHRRAAFPVAGSRPSEVRWYLCVCFSLLNCFVISSSLLLNFFFCHFSPTFKFLKVLMAKYSCGKNVYLVIFPKGFLRVD